MAVWVSTNSSSIVSVFLFKLVNSNYILFQVIKYSGPSLWPATAKYFGGLLARGLSERTKNEIIIIAANTC